MEQYGKLHHFFLFILVLSSVKKLLLYTNQYLHPIHGNISFATFDLEVMV